MGLGAWPRRSRELPAARAQFAPCRCGGAAMSERVLFRRGTGQVGGGGGGDAEGAGRGRVGG